MPKYHLAIDIGASSGRHILGWLDADGQMQIEEVYRFPNEIIQVNGSDCWDLELLFSHIIKGMRVCADISKIPCSVGIDTWGVDFVLLDINGEIIGDTVCYRDKRTDGIEKEVFKHIGESELYSRTGLQKQQYNTIYQLMAVKMTNPKHLERAKTLLMMPDYFHYKLCGVAKNEYTITTTTGLINAKGKNWDTHIIDRIGYSREMFCEIAKPGTKLGGLLPDIAAKVGYGCKVVVPASHDTASAVIAAPNEKESIYISSGTWSLLGTETIKPNCSDAAQKSGFSNEGGFGGNYRFLKNIMGLWMIQEVKKEQGDKYTFADLCDMADKTKIKSVVECNDTRFFNPKSMTEEIQNYCRETKQKVPETARELAAVIYKSLASCYSAAVNELENIIGIEYDSINIIGGGANADYLNKLTACATGKKVYAGPIEATAIGNLTVQLIASGVIDDISQARRIISNSFEIKSYKS
ncbi:MAG: rhamnulokinase [Oscillospiraceae bacterium]|nr:rhamnulokinase [Oscillospiraceae bacterium]